MRAALLRHVRRDHDVGQAVLRQHPLMRASPRACAARRRWRAPSGSARARPGRGCATVQHVHVREVARGEVQVLVEASIRISTWSRPSSASLPTSILVFGASSSRPPVTTRRSWRASSDRIERIAPRYILRLTFCAKLRGFAAKARPPPTQIGLLDRARARLARALLAPRLLAAAADFGLGQLRLGAGAARGRVGRQHLVHQRLVEFAAEGRVGDVDLGALGSAIHQLQLHCQ